REDRCPALYRPDADGQHVSEASTIGVASLSLREGDPMVQIQVDKLGRSGWNKKGRRPDVLNIRTICTLAHREVIPSVVDDRLSGRRTSVPSVASLPWMCLTADPVRSTPALQWMTTGPGRVSNALQTNSSS